MGLAILARGPLSHPSENRGNSAGAGLFSPNNDAVDFRHLEGGDHWVSSSRFHARIHYDCWRHFVRTDSEKYMP